MADKVTSDRFAQLALISVTESAANTLTFKKLETGISVVSKVAWIINKVEYFIGSLTAALFNASDDVIQYGLSVNNGWTTPSLSEETITDFNQAQRQDFGAAASAEFYFQPIAKDFTTLPGGGVLVPPNPIYLWAKGTGLVSAMTIYVRLWYQAYEMAPQDYLELVQSRQVLES